MRGIPLSAPKSEAERVVGEVTPSRSNGASVSVSKLRHTATRAPCGQDFGVSLRPTRANSTACRNCSSLHLVPGCGKVAGCENAVPKTAKTQIDLNLISSVCETAH